MPGGFSGGGQSLDPLAREIILKHLRRRDAEAAGAPMPPEPTPVDYKPEAPPLDIRPLLEAARAQSEQRKLSAGIAHAGETLSAAISGTKPDNYSSNALDESAKEPAAQVGRMAELDKVYRAARAAADAKNPGSNANQLRQQILLKAAPHIAARLGPTLKTLTGDQIDKLLPLDAGLAKDSDAKDALDIQAGNALKVTNPTSGGGGGAGGEARFDRRIDALGKATTPMSDFTSALQKVEEMLPGFVSAKAVPKNFPIDARQRALLQMPLGAGERFAKPEAIAYKKAMTEVKDLLSRARTGAVINSQEEKMYGDLISDRMLSNPAAAGEVLNQLAEKVYKKLKTAQSSYNREGVLDEYKSYGGLTYHDPLFKTWDAAPAGGPERRQGKDGKWYVKGPGGWEPE